MIKLTLLDDREIHIDPYSILCVFPDFEAGVLCTRVCVARSESFGVREGIDYILEQKRLLTYPFKLRAVE